MHPWLMFSLALLMYECMITFDHEVEYFWKRTFPGASALYIFNKYLALEIGRAHV